jgi:integrase
MVSAALPAPRAMLMTLYATGARDAELTRLKFSDFDKQRMVVHIQGGKGRKDRDVMLSSKLLEELREHWHRLRRRPKVWLFPGQHNHRGAPPIDTKTVWHACYQAGQRAGLQKRVHPHTLSWDYLADNIVRGVEMPERLLKKPHRLLNADEVRRLVAACTEPTRTIVLLAIMTGLRIGEILALRWKRIDFIRETLVVAEICYLGRFGTPKTRASKREVPLSSNVVEALNTHFSISANRNPEALVFATRNGGPLASNNLRNRGFRSACKRAGLRN